MNFDFINVHDLRLEQYDINNPNTVNYDIIMKFGLLIIL